MDKSGSLCTLSMAPSSTPVTKGSKGAKFNCQISRQLMSPQFTQLCPEQPVEQVRHLLFDLKFPLPNSRGQVDPICELRQVLSAILAKVEASASLMTRRSGFSCSFFHLLKLE